VRGYARVTPPPLHLLCKPDIFFLLFRLSIWLICEPLGKNPPPKEKPPAGRTNRGTIHVTLRTFGGKPRGKPGGLGVYRVYPGRSWTYGSVIFRICQPFFLLFFNFKLFMGETGVDTGSKTPHNTGVCHMFAGEHHVRSCLTNMFSCSTPRMC